MKAIVPVAGIGTRLRPHTYTAPKVLLPVAGKPILGHILDDLTELGIEEVTFIVGYKGEMIREYVERTVKFRTNFVEQEEMLGLGHAISLAKPYHYEDEAVLIVLGDTIFKADLASVIQGEETAIGVKKVEDPRRFGVVELDKSGHIKRLVEKPDVPPSNLAIVGLYFVRRPKVLFDCLEENIASGKRTKGEIQLTDALQLMLERGEQMRVFMVEGWYDCGKPETMLLTNRDLLDYKIQDFAEYGRLNDRYPGSVIIMPVAIDESVKIESSIVGPYVSISAGTSLRSCIVRNSIIGESAEVTNIVLQDSIISDNAKVCGNMMRLNVGDSSEISMS
ncbi:MAG: nucleotidyl transferase [Candidatus Hydrogenedentota bacterium]|nr:sugar phosphate nucleotidyltransferase [Candidatus Sumerlaea chitinivorans]RMH26282.1 MAG: nucleotidyl transferase [Candidatus Hydrogenedentota bacterium]